MTDKKPSLGKFHDLYGKIRDTLVQEDNPNSPHLVFQRMNQNMVGDTQHIEDTTQQEGPKDPRPPTPVPVKKTGKQKSAIITTDKFNNLIWGDDE